MTVPASWSKWAQPPRSKTPRSSSSGPPGPCITPSTETCVVVVSFMVSAPSCRSGRRSVASAEGERERLCSRLEELDLEQTIGDGAALPDQLVHPLLDELAGAVGFDIAP